MSEFLELFKLLGAAAGFIATIVGFWDRAIAAKPLVYLDFDVPAGHTSRQFCLNIDNNSKSAIVIDEITYDREDIYHNFYFDTEEAIERVMKYSRRAFLNPGETRTASVNFSESFLSDAAELSTVINIRWHRYTTVIPGIPIKIVITNHILRSLKRDRHAFSALK